MNPSWMTVSILGASAIVLVTVREAVVNAHSDGRTDPASARTTNDVRRSPIANRRVHPGVGEDIIVIDSMTNYYGPVFFAHELHADMSEMNGGCATCHHQEPDADVIQACEDCHDTHVGATLERPSLKGAYHRQCLGCHRDWAHENACNYCHEELGTEAPPVFADEGDPTDFLSANIPHPRIAAEPVYVYHTTLENTPIVSFHHTDHAEHFGLNCVDCHENDSCNSCHDKTVATGHEQIDRADRCMTCHSDRNCAMCHDDRERPSFAHEAEGGWALEPHHVDLTCERCHGRPAEFLQVSSNCLGCHSSIDATKFDHEKATGVPLLGSHAHFECSRCHVSRRLDAPVTCTTCHADRTYPPTTPGRK